MISGLMHVYKQLVPDSSKSSKTYIKLKKYIYVYTI